MDLKFYTTDGKYLGRLPEILTDSEAEWYVEETAEDDTELGRWLLVDEKTFNERAIWERTIFEKRPRLILRSSEYSGNWENGQGRDPKIVRLIV